MRINARVVVVLPWLVLVALTARPGAFRDFYQSGGGVVTVLVAGAASIAGVWRARTARPRARRAARLPRPRRDRRERGRDLQRGVRRRRGRGGYEPVRRRRPGASLAGCVRTRWCRALRSDMRRTSTSRPWWRTTPRADCSAAVATPVARVSSFRAASRPGEPGRPVGAAAASGRLTRGNDDARRIPRAPTRRGRDDRGDRRHRGRGVDARAAGRARRPCCGFTVGATRTRKRLERTVAERANRIRQRAVHGQSSARDARADGSGPIQAVQRVVDRGRGAVVEELRIAARRDPARHERGRSVSSRGRRRRPSRARRAPISCWRRVPSGVRSRCRRCSP